MERRTFLKLVSATVIAPSLSIGLPKKKTIAACILEMAADCKFKMKPAKLLSIVKDSYYDWNDPATKNLMFAKVGETVCYGFNTVKRTWWRLPDAS